MPLCPGEPGLQLYPTGIDIAEAESLCGVSLPHSLSLGKPESPMRHPTAAHLQICSWAPFFFTIPSREGVGVGGAGGDGRGAGEPQGCEGPACALPAPVVTPGAGRHLGSGTGLTPIILILWGKTPWVQRWLQQSSACFSVSRKPLTVLEKIMKEPSCFRAEQKNVCHITDTGGQGEGREEQD